MSSKTRIVVLHMKEVVYTILFAALAVVLVLLLVYMFGSKGKTEETSDQNLYRAGVYTSSIQLEGQTMDVQVVVDEDHINSVSLINLDKTVTTMYPLLESSMDSISEQICKDQSLDHISYSEENKYTSAVLLSAVEAALDKAKAGGESE